MDVSGMKLLGKTPPQLGMLGAENESKPTTNLSKQRANNEQTTFQSFNLLHWHGIIAALPQRTAYPQFL